MSKKLFATIFCYAFFTSCHSMNQHLEVEKYTKNIPLDIKEHILLTGFRNVHNYVKTPKEARDYIVCIGLANKKCSTFVNDPHIIKDIIHNLSATLRIQDHFVVFEKTIAEILNIPASKKYLELNNQFFNEHLTKKNVKSLVQQGADVRFRQIIPFRCPEVSGGKYNQLRYLSTGTPLTFFTSGTRNEDLTIVRYLLKRGANVNQGSHIVESTRHLPLSIAIQYNIPQMVSLLLTYNPQFMEQDFPGNDQNYLQQAVEKDCKEIINSILEHKFLCKSNTNIDFKLGLQAAIIKNNIPLIHHLLNSGATSDMVFQEVLGKTLQYPYPSKTTDMLQLLCEHGITPQTRQAALNYARQAQQRVEKVIALLGANEDYPEDLPDLIPLNLQDNV